MLFATLDNYCERTGPEFWSEPVNALTNLAFILAGLYGLRLVRVHSAGRLVRLLDWWVVAVGVGSFLFHTFANRLTLWMDVLPIAAFTFAYTAFAIRRFLGYGRVAATAIFAVFYAIAFLLTWLVPEEFQEASAGSTGYLPAFLALLVFGLWTAGRRHPAAPWLVAAAGVFLVSVMFRTLDPYVCEAYPLGTHFLWHSLNGLMLGLLMVAAARYGAIRGATDGSA